MQKFNLEKAKAGQKVMTKSGDPVRIVCYDVKNSHFPILALVTNKDGIEEAKFYTKDGVYFGLDRENILDLIRENTLDLVMAPELREAWINIYSFSKAFFRHETEEEAIKNIANKDNKDDYITTIRIEWTE